MRKACPHPPSPMIRCLSPLRPVAPVAACLVLLPLAAAAQPAAAPAADGGASPPASPVWPRPQQIQIAGNSGVVFRALRLVSPAADPDALQLLGRLVPLQAGAEATVSISQGAAAGLKAVSGAYRLTIAPTGIAIEAIDGRGAFYAVQTLAQLFRDGRLPVATITDHPVVPRRGVVEGFYGTPWSHQARLDQLRFYGRFKLDTYIYGPKDDPFHGFSTRWREPYPADKAEQIRELVRVAKANKVDFVWAVHPGRDIKWGEEDTQACLRKFQLMYDLGVRSFAVFFDDIGGEGAKAEKQAELLNRLHRDFVKAKPDVTPLLLCPTEYNQAWADPKPGTYLDILGEQLDPSIQVMWTGESVVHDISRSSMDWINRRLRRPAFIWWNYPVTDFVRNHLLLGKVYGNEPSAAHVMAGFTSNPMDKPEASKIALFGVADYSWNPDTYNPGAAWDAAIWTLYPGCGAAMRTFAAHNSDHGPNSHGYRREESAALVPALKAFLDTYQKDAALDPKPAAALKDEFARIQAAPGRIRADSGAAAFVAETAPWLDAFAALGGAGSNVLALAEARCADAPDATRLPLFLGAAEALETMKRADRSANQNPYQRGIKTGSLHLAPFVDTLFREEARRLQARLAGLAGPRAAGSQTAGAFRILTNVPLLANHPVNRQGKFIGLTPMNEVLPLPPGGFVGLALPEGFAANYLHLKLENPKAGEFGRLEVSTDGAAWSPFACRANGGELQNPIDPAKNIRFARFTNASSQAQDITIKLFKFDVPAEAEANSLAQAADGDLATAFRTEPKPGQRLEIPNPEPTRPMDAVTLVMLPAPVTVSACDAANQWRAVPLGRDLRVALAALRQPVKAIALEAAPGKAPPTLTLFEAVWQARK